MCSIPLYKLPSLTQSVASTFPPPVVTRAQALAPVTTTPRCTARSPVTHVPAVGTLVKFASTLNPVPALLMREPLAPVVAPQFTSLLMKELVHVPEVATLTAPAELIYPPTKRMFVQPATLSPVPLPALFAVTLLQEPTTIPAKEAAGLLVFASQVQLEMLIFVMVLAAEKAICKAWVEFGKLLVL